MTAVPLSAQVPPRCRVVLPAVVAILLTITPTATLLAGDRASAVAFSWALIYQDNQGELRPIDYGLNVVPLESGDRFKFYLKPLKPCYLYLYLYDSDKNLYLLFPENLEPREHNAELVRNFELPGVNSWFYLDEQGGIELFYLIASPRRLHELERKTARYMEGQPAQSQNARSLSGKHEVLDAIRRLVKENSYLSDAAEKPIAVAGDFRGVRQEHELNGIRIEAADVYVKTIRLQH